MKIAVELEETDWMQILDGLRCRAEIYEDTFRYYESGHAESEIAEVRDGNEARELADLYWSIIGKIERTFFRG